MARRRPLLPPVAIVGFGRVGEALGRALKAARWPVVVFARSARGTRAARAASLPLGTASDLRLASLCLLAVPDGSVPIVASATAPAIGRDTALVHLAGALSLAALGQKHGLPVGSFHPLVAVSHGTDALAGHAVAIAASTNKLRRQLRHMARAVHLTPIEVPERNRAAYHASAVLSAGLLVALLDTAIRALESSGLKRGKALQALLPLAQSAIRAVEKRGVARGLTGPLVRGDSAAVEAHLHALPPALRPVYVALSRRALDLLPALAPATKRALERALRA